MNNELNTKNHCDLDKSTEKYKRQPGVPLRLLLDIFDIDLEVKVTEI